MDHLSPSFISKYEACPLAALYYREDRPKVWDPRYAEQGRWTHSTLQRIYSPGCEIYRPECPIDSEMQRRHSQSLSGYEELRRQEPRFEPGTPDGRHHPEVHVSGAVAGVPIVGFVDLLTINKSTVYIDDWKTGLFRKTDEQQIRIYTMLISKILGVPPTHIVATLDYLREDPQRIQRRVAYTSTQAIEHHIIEDVIKPIYDLQFPPNRGKACARCEYRHICEAW